MFPLIYLNDNDYLYSFELRNAKNSIIGCLERLNVNFYTNFKYENYDLIHFLSLNDYASFLLDKKDSNECKTCLSLLYFEETKRASLLKKTNTFDPSKNEVSISKSDISLLNKIDCLLVPSLRAMEFLRFLGVITDIKVFSFPIRSIKYDVNDEILKNLIFRYLGIDNTSYLVSTYLNINDKLGYERIKEVANRFPKVKFILLYEDENRKNSIAINKKINKDKPINLYFIKNIDEDLNTSLMFNSKIFLALNSLYGNNQNIDIAMASKTQVITLKNSCFKDIAIDKKNSYIYNDLESLCIGMTQYIDGLLPSTIEEGMNLSKEKTVQNEGEKLINIYKNILGE